MKRLISLSLLVTGAVVLGCSILGPQGAAQSPPPPPTPPPSPTEAKLPRDNDAHVPQDGVEGWTKIEPSEKAPAEKFPKAKYVKVSLKKNKKDGTPVQQTEELRIKKIGYYKKGSDPLVYVESNTTSTQSANGDESQVEIPADADMSRPIFVKVYTVNITGGTVTEVIPANPPINKNFCLLYDGGNKVVSVGHGGGTVVSTDVEGDTTLLDLAEDVLLLSDEDYEQPDLMLWCTDIIKPGIILFCPVGDFEFSSVPAAIHVFDKSGVDLAAAEKITLGEAYLTPRGDVAIAVSAVDVESLSAFGMIVRGVNVTMFDNADPNSVHCYCTGGSSLRFLEGDVCAIAQGTRVLDNWELLQWSANYSLGTAAAIVSEDNVVLGSPFVDLVSGSSNSGFLDGIVIEGSSNNAIKNGQVIFRAVSGWQFELVDGEGSTKAYILNADTGVDLYNEGISASVGLSSHGDLVIALNNVETYCSNVRIKVVITGLRAAYNAPVPRGVGYKLECYGSSLRAPLRIPQVIIEGEGAEVSAESGPLPQEPIAVTGWTPVATSP